MILFSKFSIIFDQAKQEAHSKMNGLLNENDSLSDMLDQEQEEKSILQDKLLKANAEAGLWKGKYEKDALPQIEELEEAK